MKKRIISALLCAVMCIGAISTLSSCSKKNNVGTTKPDAFVIMSESLDGVFNPFYSTTAPDATIVGMTQMSMLTYGYVNNEVVVACGDDEAVVVKDYEITRDEASDKTTYTFVIKNGIKYSDGKPLTMNDVLFNFYVYLDPVYTGSSTMYSTDIVGLQEYRTQKSSNKDDSDDQIAENARQRAKDRINELVNLFVAKLNSTKEKSVSYTEMCEAIKSHSLSNGYKKAISNDTSSVTVAQLQADYDLALKYFKEELDSDYESAKEAYKEEPYKSTGEFDELTSFMYAEGFVDIEYEKDANNKDIKSKIKKVTRNYNVDVVTDKASAINYVYNAKINTELDQILKYWATAQTLQSEYAAQAKDVILHENLVDGELIYKNISGIVSLGHTTDVSSVTCKNGTYTVAHEHNEDGTVKNDGEYDVLQVTINGVDPKAIWNFAFAVAPQHYYAKGYKVDIKNNEFGVEWGSFKFMKEVIQNPDVTKVPVGAGSYMATDINNNDNPNGNDFYKDNVVYFKANKNFLMGTPKIEKVRYKVISASNALDSLEQGEVHFVTPQFTQENIERIDSLKNKGVEQKSTDQLGYGYIGINAGLVPDINIRRAIMTAMDTSLALSYYSKNTAETIYWPMSTVSWAYPKNPDGSLNRDNGHYSPKFNEADVRTQIKQYMEASGVSEGDKSLSIKFTIAGSNLTDHPTYLTFQKAAEILNSCGWQIEVVPDTQALTKLSTGSLAVWAAAWGSSIDPDMYQVYHKNSTATSVYAWGYREILAQPGNYPEENAILNDLSDIIDQARETEDQKVRTELYKTAMGYVLDLAVELPVYQRDVLYAYNANVIKSSTLPEQINPYTSPLDSIWKIEFVD